MRAKSHINNAATFGENIGDCNSAAFNAQLDSAKRPILQKKEVCMSEPIRRYQQWLEQFDVKLQKLTDKPLETMAELLNTISDYAKASADLTAYESRLFVETFFRQQQDDTLPNLWPERLWQQLSEITDRTQVEWLELPSDLQHQGCYLQGELVGMGHYHCEQCGAVQVHFHPAALLSCTECQHVRFYRRGLPV